MSFRQAKSHRHADDRAWREWLSLHGPALKALAIPPGLTLSEAHWIDFLQNGYLERHPDSYDGFTLDGLTVEQSRGLLAVLESSPAYVEQPMVEWLRYRLRDDAAG